VAIVSKPATFACAGERLTWAGSRPYRPVVRPSGHAQGERPGSDAGKPMTLHVAGNVAGPHVADVSLIDIAGRNKSSCDEIA
jgi:hypothetical protein